MRVVTYNIHYGFGRDGRNDLDRIAESVEAADVIALQEVERFWPRSGMMDQVAMLAKRLPEHWVAYGPNIDLASPAGFAGEVATARRQFGNLILSRLPIASISNVSLPRPGGTDQTMQRGALEATIEIPGGRTIRFYSVHLDYLSAATRNLQLQVLAAHHESTAVQGGPWQGRHAVNDEWTLGDEPATTGSAVLLGDINIAAGSEEYRLALQSLPGFADAWDLAGNREPGSSKDGERIDHGWITADLAATVRSAWIDTTADGSDHQPVWFELDL